MKNTLLLLLLGLCLYSCQKEKYYSPTYQKGICLTEINGTEWVGECDIALLKDDSIYMSFLSYNDLGERRRHLYFSNIPVKNLHAEIPLKHNFSNKYEPRIAFVTILADGDVLGTPYVADTLLPNSIFLEHYDAKSGILSGRFELNMVSHWKPVFDDPETVAIKNGRFSVRVE